MNANRFKYNWSILYFDGFAGSGSRDGEFTLSSEEIEAGFNNLLDVEVPICDIEVYKGAAERVVSIENDSFRGFDEFIFIDQDLTSISALKKKLDSYHTKGNKYYKRSDANKELIELADRMKKNVKIKSLVMLDPFGMQINWKSISELKALSVDLWILIPSGVIVNRLMERTINKDVKLKYANKLEHFFGLPEDDIKKKFYDHKNVQLTLFEDTGELISKVDGAISKITQLYIERLKTIFNFVSDEPLILYNKNNVSIYHLAFASNNKNAAKIAQQIITKENI